MSPFIIVVIFVLTVLFFILSIIPLLPGGTDMDSHHHPARAKRKGAN